MAEWRDRSEDLRAAGAAVIAISVDDAARSEALRREMKLPFSILCDTRREAVNAFGLLNGREMGGIAYAAVFVIGPGRMVRFRALEDTHVRVDTRDVVALVRALNEGREGAPLRPRRIRPGAMFLRAAMNALRRGFISRAR